jgi:DNA-binding SARP family transcriptional activator
VTKDKTPLTAGSLQIHFLGGFAVRRNGAAIKDFAYNKVRALLAYLLLERDRAHAREQLAELLWPGAPALKARNNLSNALHHLRRLLGDDGLRLESEGKQQLSLHATRRALDFDVDRLFQEAGRDGPSATLLLEAQVALYRGRLLDGLLLPDAPEFDQWLRQRQEACLQRTLELHQRLIGLYNAQGQAADALRHARCRFDLLPWQEEHCLQLMHMLQAQEQTGAALRIYDRHCHCLLQEFGLPAAATVQALADRLRTPWSVPAPAAHLQMLGRYRRLAQWAAVIGRRFDSALLAALWQQPSDPLEDGLALLCQTGVARDLGHGQYIFSHAQGRDLAYATLPAVLRREWHGELCSVLLQKFPERIARDPSLLAHHLDAAQDVDAGQAWLEAGEHCASRRAHHEAVAHYRRGLLALERRRDAPHESPLALQLHLRLGHALAALQGKGSSASRAHLHTARVLAGGRGPGWSPSIAPWNQA